MTLVLFDMDGVLNHYEYEWRQGELARLAGLEITEFKRLWLDSGWEDAAEAGVPNTGQGYLDGFNEILGSSIRKIDWLQVRKQAMTPNMKTLEIAQALGVRHKIAVLTNNGAMLIEHIDALAPEVREVFGGNVFASSQFKTRKPDVLVFERCLEKLDVTTQDAIFIDDSMTNAKGAERAGLRAIHFTQDMELEKHPYIAELLA